MKKLYTFILLFIGSLSAYAQIDTANGRYWDPVFSTVTLTSNITYGQNTKYNGQNQILKMDVYEPAGDTVQLRPLIVWAHGGSFIGGTKTDYDIATLSNTFTKMGYVCVSVEYRLGFFPIDSVNAIKAVLRATQDLKAAVRWFRQDAAGANTYRIHPNYIFVGGSSAGAFMALHSQYMDAAEFPLGITTLNSLGGIDGTSGNPGFSSDALAVVNLCGALGDSSYLQAGDVPLCSMHGDADGIVPFGSTTIQIIGIPIMPVDGSASIKVRADNLGINNPFFPWWGADHVPYAANNAVGYAYMDTTVQFVKEFLRPFLGLPLGVSSQQNDAKVVSVYPNPFANELIINNKDRNTASLLIYNALGQKIYSQEFLSGSCKLQTANWNKGIYFGEVKYKSGKRNVFKVVKQ